jgi:hypothetical protein
VQLIVSCLVICVKCITTWHYSSHSDMPYTTESIWYKQLCQHSFLSYWYHWYARFYSIFLKKTTSTIFLGDIRKITSLMQNTSLINIYLSHGLICNWLYHVLSFVLSASLHDTIHLIVICHTQLTQYDTNSYANTFMHIYVYVS